MLSRTFGSDSRGLATVLAGFMAGLAVGSLAAVRWSDRAPRPLRVYAALEGAIAAFTVISLPLFDLAGGAVDTVLAGHGLAAPVRTAALFSTSFVILLVPTFLMGATFPTLAALAADGSPLTLHLLYGANTLGAGVGALAGGFLLVPNLGFRRTLLVAASVNVAAALLALSLRPGPRARLVLPPPPDEPRPQTVEQASILAFLALSGAATMAYELVVARLTAMTFGSSVYAFALVIAAFLLGIGGGGIAYHVITTGSGARGRVPTRLPTLVSATGVAFIVLTYALGSLPRISFHLHAITAPRVGLTIATTMVTLSLMLLVPAMLLGATFPATLRALADRRRIGIGPATGIGTAVNTLGATAGAVASGFWLVPRIGLERLMVTAALATLIAGLLLAWSMAGARRAAPTALIGAGLLLLLLRPPWPLPLFADGLFRSHVAATDFASVEADVASQKLLFYRDGPAATVAVLESSDGIRSLRVNGKADASNNRLDLQTQLLLGHLPALLHPAPHAALVIGLGSGATAHALAEHPTVERVDVAEIEPAVAEAATFFADINLGVLTNPKVALHIEDGRRFVRHPPRHYDIIVSEPSNPWVAGVADLYTREHVAGVLRSLSPGGIFAQWIHGYDLDRRWIDATLATVASVFPYVSLWYTNTADFVVIAAREPLRIDLDRLRRRLVETPRIEAELGATGIFGPRASCSRFLLGNDSVRRLVAGAPVMRDDLPLLEYQAPFDLYRDDTSVANFNHFAAAADPCPVDTGPVPSRQEALEWLGLAAALQDTQAPILLPRAIAAFETSANLAPEIRTYLGWAKALVQAGDTESARQIARRALALDPEEMAREQLDTIIDLP